MLLPILLMSVSNLMGEDCVYGFVDGVEDCGGGVWAYSACSEYNPAAGAYTIRIYDDGCAYVVTA